MTDLCKLHFPLLVLTLLQPGSRGVQRVEVRRLPAPVHKAVAPYPPPWAAAAAAGAAAPSARAPAGPPAPPSPQSPCRGLAGASESRSSPLPSSRSPRPCSSRHPAAAAAKWAVSADDFSVRASTAPPTLIFWLSRESREPSRRPPPAAAAAAGCCCGTSARGSTIGATSPRSRSAEPCEKWSWKNPSRRAAPPTKGSKGKAQLWASAIAAISTHSRKSWTARETCPVDQAPISWIRPIRVSRAIARPCQKHRNRMALMQRNLGMGSYGARAFFSPM
mmetsp:Transcript_11678/g.17944  ORF Transcript_11678/g.17944 Transcript_11678/m.17944 type:complete len:277 (+) Transcript_11678:212-1042(+)